jgi:hypothetical protein
MEEIDIPDVQPDGPLVDSRACEACGLVKPLDRRRWPLVPGTQHTLQPICKACYKLVKHRQKVETTSRRAAEAFMRAPMVRKGGSNIPHSTELLESIYGLFGGVNGLANELAHTYHSAPPGGRIRTSILETVVRLTNNVADSGAVQKPVSLLTDDELEQRLAQKIALAAESQKNLEYLNQSTEVEIPDGMIQANQIPVVEIEQAMSMRRLVEVPHGEPS